MAGRNVNTVSFASQQVIRLEIRSGRTNHGTGTDGPPSTKSVGRVPCSKRAYCLPNIIQGDDSTFQVSEVELNKKELMNAPTSQSRIHPSWTQHVMFECIMA